MFLVFILAIITFFSTMIGGAVALKARNYLPYVFAFASGSLLGVALSDILPESLKIFQTLNVPLRQGLIIVIISFIFYSFIERFFLTHHSHGDHTQEHGHAMGPVGASGLVTHSFLDGIAIGIAFKISAAIGMIVALAVIFHDFTDGINTVTVMLKNKQKVVAARAFLVADALAPLIGVIVVTFFITISQFYLAIILAIFAGEFLYLGTTSLLPETYKHSYWKMTLLMVCGAALIIILTSFI